MGADPWSEARGDFERLLALAPAERERWLATHDARRAGAARALLALDQTPDELLDSDAPALHAAWLAAHEDGRHAPRAELGSEVGGYRLVEVLGEGGSAVVYRAEGATGAAVKVLKHEASSPGLARRFEQEREALAGLEHPGLIRVLGAGHLADGRPYLITEHVAGERIDAHCQRAGLDLAGRLRLFVLVCRAVHHAHRHLVVHRDLKPANILVSADGEPKVLDFGVAKLLDPERDPLWTDLYGRGPLTPAYASPEQIRGQPVTTAADIYSLGVLLHELVTGASPYAEPPEQRAALERAVAAGRRRSARDAARASGRAPPPRDVEAILERALALTPAERYASAEHLAEDVVCFLEQRPLRSRAEPWTRRAARFARRRPWTLALAAALALLLLGSWIGTRRSLSRVMASESIAWRAHASAVHSTNLLADLLEGLGARAVAAGGGEELARLVAETEQHLEELADHPETEARLRMALARLERARARPAAAEQHLARALELTRGTRGLSWRDTEHCLAQLCELLAERADPACVPLARERLDLCVAHRDVQRAEQARRVLAALLARFAPADPAR